VVSALPPAPARVLEVGAGDGALAERLIRQGWDVVPLDRAGEAAVEMRSRGLKPVQREFLEYDGRPFAALLFTRSLHHLHPLADTLDHARELLVMGGHLVAEELAFEEADGLTALWLAEHEARCHEAGLMAREPVLAGANPDPLATWMEHHRVHHTVHSGADLLDEIEHRFVLERIERVPYLYRYLASNLRQDPEAAAVVSRALAEERAATASGALRAVGLRIVARPRGDRF
jgi:hypothetical protein